MDEIDLLRAVGSDVAPTRSAAKQAARAALIAVATEVSDGPTFRWPRLRLQPPRLVLPAVIVSLVVVLALGVVPLGDRPDPAAAAALTAVADVAAALPAPGAVGYRHTKSEGAWLSGIGGPAERPDGIWALVPKTRELWVKRDGSGRLIETRGRPIWFGPADKAAWVAAGSPDLGGGEHTDTRFGPTPPGADPSLPEVWPGSLHYEDVDALPTDPSALRQLIDQRAGGFTDYQRFTIVGDLLRETVAAPQVRAAIYRVAAGLGGVQLIGSMTDRAGRTGTAVAMTSERSSRGLERRILIFDPSTSMLLEEEQVLLNRVDYLDADPPIVIGYATYLVSDIVQVLP